MGRFVVKLGEEQYLLYSSVVDSPITYVMNRKKMADYLVKAEAGLDYMADSRLKALYAERVEKRLKSADEKGTSAVDCEDLSSVEFCNRAGPKGNNIKLSQMAEMYKNEESYKKWTGK